MSRSNPRQHLGWRARAPAPYLHRTARCAASRPMPPVWSKRKRDRPKVNLGLLALELGW